MTSKQIYIVGAGSYGEAVLDLAQECGYEVLGFFDDDASKKGQKVFDVEILGQTKDIWSMDLQGLNFAVAIGNNPVRRGFLEKIRSLRGSTPSLIHPSVHISQYASVGEGVYIQPRAIIWTKAEIGNDCIISPGVVIAHHSKLHAGCLVSTLTSVGSNITIEQDVFIGMGCTIMTGLKTVGANSTIGAGAVVIKDVQPNSVMAGVPAKLIRVKE